MIAPDAFRLVASLPPSQRDHVIEQLAIAFPAAVEAAVKFAQMLEQGAASNGNPYGSFPEAKHGRYDAPSAGEAARCSGEMGFPCYRAAGHSGAHHSRPLEPPPHLPQHMPEGAL